MKAEVTYAPEVHELVAAEIPFIVECNDTNNVFYVYKHDETLTLYAICICSHSDDHKQGNEYSGLYRDGTIYSLFKGVAHLSN
jgi:hypothetical protein